MPLAQAHARRLLRRGKAQLLAHHLFTIIQLTRAIEPPILRPVLLGIAVHRATIELFVIAEGTCAVFPLLYVIADLQLTRTDRLPLTTPPYGRPTQKYISSHISIMSNTVAELLMLVPISHVCLLSTSLPWLTALRMQQYSRSGPSHR